jgi:hypothetical protein
MSNLTDLLPAGAGGKQVDFVASGTIGNGVTVGLNSDGTVSGVSSVSQALGSNVEYTTGNTAFVATAFDSNANKVVIAYRNGSNSSYGEVVIGTVSGTSISFGTAVVFETANSQYMSLAFDSSNNKIVIAYKDDGNSGYGTSIVGTVSGTSISFGTSVVFASQDSNYISCVYDANSQKIVIAFTDGSTDEGIAIVGTVSGTSISFGTAVVFTTHGTYLSCAYDSSSNKTIIAYRNNTGGNLGTAIVGTVSGTSISFGTASVYNAGITDYVSATFDSSSNKIVIAYRDASNSSYGTAVVGTVSGTSISFGTEVIFNSYLSDYIGSTYDSNAKKVCIVYRDDNIGQDGTIAIGVVSGNNISFESPVTFESGEGVWNSAAFNTENNTVIIGYMNGQNANRGEAVVFKNSSTNSADFIGISDAAISDTASGSVTIKGGISTNVTGLTPNQNYYVQADGSLSTTASTVLAGKALSSTSINLDYTT